MQIQINGKKRQLLDESRTITQLLAAEKVESPDMVSVQLNGRFVARELYPETRLQPGDEVEFLYFMGGGR